MAFDSTVQLNKKDGLGSLGSTGADRLASASIRRWTDAKMTTAINSPSNLTDFAGREKYYRIGELASEFEITLRTLRFYEDRGLIQPARFGQSRYYSEKDREQLRICLLCKQSGMALADIKHVLKLHATIDEGQSQRSELMEIYLSRLSALRKQQILAKLAIAELRSEIERIRDNPRL